MKTKILDFIDFEKVNLLLEGFNKSTGFVTAILDLNGNILSKSGWRDICTEFHRVNPETAEKCKKSDTILANKTSEGDSYHFYKCLNGLVDVAVPIVIKGEHIANLFSGQFFFEAPDLSFFKKQAKKYGFNEVTYLRAIEKVPVVSKEKVKTAMDFLLNMTQMISEITYQKIDLAKQNESRKKNEAALKESEEKYRSFFENSMDAILITEPDGAILAANPSACKMFGRSEKEIIRLGRDCLIDSADPRLPLLLAKREETGKARGELFFRHKDGTRFPGEISSAIFSYAEGRRKTSMIIRDISERKEAELEMERLLAAEKSSLLAANKTREQLSQILDRISDGFGSLDRDWTYTYVNEQLAKNVGKKREDMLGRVIWDVFPEAIGTPVHKAYLRAMKEQVVVDLEHYYPPFRRWFQHRFYPSPDGLSVFSRDITENKLAEEKIKENSSLIRIAAEKAKLGGWNVILDENRSYWSDVVAAIHEMPPGYAPLVEDGINFYAPEWRDKITTVFSECAQKGIPYDEEMEILTSTGKRVWVRTIGEAVRDKTGRIFKVQGAFQDISEKKMAEAKSREKDLQFRKLSSNVPDLIFQFTRKSDGSYCVPLASEGIRNIFGCSPEDVVDDFTPIAKVIYPDDAERVIAEIEYSAEHLTYFTCEFRVQIPGKPVQWIFSRSNPEKLTDGSITWYGFNANITNIKKVEEALRESEEKYRNMFVNNPQPMWIYDLESLYFLEVNDAAINHYGYTRDEFLKMTLKDIRPPEDVEALLRDVQLTRKALNPAGEWRHLKKNGELINVEIVSHSVTFNNRNARHVLITDITERKKSEEKIIKLNDRLQLLIDVIKDLSIASGLEEIMKIVRTAARKMVNADGSTFVMLDGEYCYYADEDTISPLWKGQRFPLNSCISGWAMINKQPVRIEDIYSDPRIPIEAYRSTFVKSLAMVPIRISDPIGAIGAYWSINYVPSETDLQLLQTLADATARAVENIQLMEGLENMVNIRTSQLEAANKELEAFSYSVSHDLRAPLRHINGFAEILKKQYSDDLPKDSKKHLNIIIGSAKKMGTLIDDLLSFSRTGRAELKKTTLKMNNVIEDAIAQINPSLKGRKINWKISSLPDVQGDYNLLRMVWVNLLDNALKYTINKEKAVIQIGHKEEKTEIVFYIKDNGVGFDMKYVDNLFGVFQRLHSSTQFEGTGIGLANVKRIILRHGGRTWAEAEVDKGATFYFVIPKEALGDRQ
jgi:hypothetical protein